MLPAYTKLIVALALVSTMTFGMGCAVEDEDYGILGPLQQSQHALSSSGIGSPALSSSFDGARTAVWEVRNQWADTNTSEAREAGMAWAADSGLNWDEKYAVWVQSLDETSTFSGNRRTFRITNPQGKTLDVPALECAELALMMRSVFAAWYGLPFFLEAQDAAGTRVFLGHFGFRTATGRYKNTPEFRTRYNNYSHLTSSDALSSWPQDSQLRGRHLYNRRGHDDFNPFLDEDAGAGWYFDELLLNKRVGHFLLLLLPYFGSMHLADDANAYHTQPESLRAGDILLKRWQRRGIGHVMLVKDVQERPEGKLAAELASGSMPRRQALWESQAASKMLFTNDYTGGVGENNDGETYVNLGGGLKRFLVAEESSGRWRNRVLSSDLSDYIRWSRRSERASRPERFRTLLVTVSPDELREELLAIIDAKRDHLRSYPASCSARIAREDAFEELYSLCANHFDMSRDQVDAEYRLLEDYVFAELVYDESKTCCWNSTDATMFDIVMNYNLTRQEAAGACLAPTVFKAQDGGYEVFANHADSMGIGNRWKAWSADENCPQGNTLNDVEETHGWTPYCEISGALGDTPETDAPVVPDPFEPNNSMDAAHLLEDGTYTGASIGNNDEDWFTFQPLTGATVRFKVEFEHDNGDIDLQMFRGLEQIDRSNGTRDDEEVRGTYEGTEPITVLVLGHESATNAYTISVVFEGGVDLGEPCDDDNETLESAFEIGAGVYPGLRICNGDVDWFRIRATTSGGPLSIEFSHGEGNLDLELYRSSGELIDSSTSTTDNETIESGAGVRYLKVFGRNGAMADYTLRIVE